MTVTDVIAALTLPPESRVDQRVPKKLLIENGAPTPADKRQINEGIKELIWLAALKPTTIGVSEYRDDIRDYLEIAILSLALRPTAKAGRVVELIHRAIPYPVLLISQQSEVTALSLAHKRWSQGETGKMVLDDAVTSCELIQHPTAPAFFASLSLVAQTRAHLMALYQGWMDRVQAFKAACITGRFVESTSREASETRSRALMTYARLTREIAILRARAKNESQVNRRAEVNLEIKRLLAVVAELIQKL